MKNIIDEATRITETTKTLLDLIITNKLNLAKRKGVLPLDISDHHLFLVLHF